MKNCESCRFNNGNYCFAGEYFNTPSSKVVCFSGEKWQEKKVCEKCHGKGINCSNCNDLSK